MKKSLLEIDEPAPDYLQPDTGKATGTPKPDHVAHLADAIRAVALDDSLDCEAKLEKIEKLLGAMDTNTTESRRFRRGRGRSLLGKSSSVREFSEAVRGVSPGRRDMDLKEFCNVVLRPPGCSPFARR